MSILHTWTQYLIEDALFEVIESKSVLRPTKTGRPLPVPSLTSAKEQGLDFTLLELVANNCSKRCQGLVVSDIIADVNGAAVASSQPRSRRTKQGATASSIAFVTTR